MYAVTGEPLSYLPPTLWAITDACMAPPLMRPVGSVALGYHSGGGDSYRHPTTICRPRTPDQALILRDDAMVQVEGNLSTFFDLHTPTLLDLRISADTRDEPTAPDSVLFPHAFNLRHLSILVSGRSIPILSYIAFPNLAAIHISFRGSYVGRRRVAPVRPIATLGQLLDIFRSSPLLEDVYLTFRVLTTEPGVSHHIVPLPRLRKFITSCNPTPTPLLTSTDSPRCVGFGTED